MELCRIFSTKGFQRNSFKSLVRFTNHHLRWSSVNDLRVYPRFRRNIRRDHSPIAWFYFWELRFNTNDGMLFYDIQKYFFKTLRTICFTSTFNCLPNFFSILGVAVYEQFRNAEGHPLLLCTLLRPSSLPFSDIPLRRRASKSLATFIC